MEQSKYDKILDALWELLREKEIQSISVSDIAAAAGMAKGTVYYYFPSKDAILQALVERSYEKPIQEAKKLAKQTDIPPFTRMAMIFQACRNSSYEFRSQEEPRAHGTQEEAQIHQKYLRYLITELKPVLTDINKQAIESGDISFDNPEALSEIALIVLCVKIDNTIFPSTKEEIAQTLRGLVSLIEKGTSAPPGTLNYIFS